jgi:hypothetical protein
MAMQRRVVLGEGADNTAAGNSAAMCFKAVPKFAPGGTVESAEIDLDYTSVLPCQSSAS